MKKTLFFSRPSSSARAERLGQWLALMTAYQRRKAHRVDDEQIGFASSFLSHGVPVGKTVHYLGVKGQRGEV